MRFEFDNQINPGNSGGPVLDESGRVVGVAVETLPGAELNRAIPASQLARFFERPGLVFDPPPFDYFSRAQPVKWTIRLVPPKPNAQLARGLSVAVTLSDGAGRPRIYQARQSDDGTFEATLAAVPREPDWRVDVSPTPMPDTWGGNPLVLRVPDEDVRGGGTQFMLSVLRKLRAGRPLRAPEKQAPPGSQSFLRLGKATKKVGSKSEAIDLNRVETLDVWARNPPGVHHVHTVVEAKNGSEVLATVKLETVLNAPPGLEVGLKSNVIVVITPRPKAPPQYSRPPVDQDLLKLGGVLDLDGTTRDAAASIRPTQAAIPAARLMGDNAPATMPPLVRQLGGKISDVAVGGGGRYLLLLLKEEQKLAIFDANVADVVKTINLPSRSAMVAAGATRFLVAFPDEKLIQCWNFDPLGRRGSISPSPIDGRLKTLAMGSDADGPVLVLWSREGPFVGAPDTQFSFLDLDSLAVLRVGLIAARGARGSISTTGGSFRISSSASDLSDRARLRVGGRRSLRDLADGADPECARQGAPGDRRAYAPGPPCPRPRRRNDVHRINRPAEHRSTPRRRRGLAAANCTCRQHAILRPQLFSDRQRPSRLRDRPRRLVVFVLMSGTRHRGDGLGPRLGRRFPAAGHRCPRRDESRDRGSAEDRDRVVRDRLHSR